MVKSPRLRIAAPFAVFFMSASLALGQPFSLPSGFLTTNGASGSAFPFNSGTNHTWQWVYDSTQFPAAPGSILITEISVRALNFGAIPNAFNFGSVEVTLASSPNHYGVGTPPLGQDTVFANNLATDATICRPAAPFTGGPIAAGTWLPLGLTTPFLYNPAVGLDFVVQLRVCGGTSLWGTSIDGVIGGVGIVGGNRYGSTSNCAATTRSFNNNEYVPVVRVDWVPGGPVTPQWQINQPGSSFDVDGVTQNSLFSPLSLTRCAGSNVTVNFNSTNVGLPWDLVISLVTPNISTNSGGFLTAGGQVLNIDVTSPTLSYLNGLAFNVPFAPVSVPFGLPVGIPRINAQQVCFDPGLSDGFALSAATALLVVSGSGTIPGPVGDDSAVTVTTGLSPLCSCPSIPFFGSSYTQLHVITNGRAMFGGVADLDFSPTVIEALTDQPFVGAWNDLNTNVGGNITITALSFTVFQINYNAVGYFATTGTANTFSITFDCTTGNASIDNLTGISVHPTAAPMFLGISPGIVGATDPGPTAFTTTVGNSMGSPTAMIYAFGPGGTLTPGLNQIVFSPDPLQFPNYTWSGF